VRSRNQFRNPRDARYGDVLPRSELAKSLAIVEAVGGQMYLAVLIARLVSLYSRQVEI